MLNKRGASSHLEVIISFTLFSMFVLSLLLYVNPYKTTTLPDTLLKNIQESFIENNSVELTKFFLLINKTHTGCIDVSIPSELTLLGESRVFDSNGFLKISEIGGNGIIIDSSSNDFYVYLSPVFIAQTTGCTAADQINCGAGDCSIGSVQNKKIVSETRILSMKSNYETNYNNLKIQLGIPENVDFAIVSEEFGMEMYIPEDLEVISKSYSTEVLYSNGDILNKEFIFKIW